MALITRRKLFDIMHEKYGKSRAAQIEHLFQSLIQHFKIENEDEEKYLKKAIYRTCSKIFLKIDQASKKLDRFLSKNEDWLNEPFCYNKEDEPTPSTSSGHSGRPKLPFSQITERAKRKRARSLTETYEREELYYATKKSLKEEGKKDASQIMSETVFSSPTRATKIMDSWKSRKHVIPLSEEEAVSLVVEAHLSKHQYQLIRETAIKQGADIYPPYNNVIEAKVRCYPKKDAITITETSADVRLQELLDHTTERILEVQKSAIETLEDKVTQNLSLAVKWGSDGSTGHVQYKQKFTEIGSIESDLFMSSLVPLQLSYQDQNEEDKLILWQNPRPSSTRYCRPIRFLLQKETIDLTLKEQEYIEEQISNLRPFMYKIGDHNISVKYICIMSMIDGKICNALTETSSSQKCYICQATPKEMNNLDAVMKKKVNEETFKFGLSTLHEWIRCFECLLHISYRLEIKKWQIRKTDEKDALKARKKKIQEDFKNIMGLLVDFPKPGGSGTTNDGNTARRFFKNSAQSASITGIDECLIKRFYVLLRAMSSGYKIDVNFFQKYAEDTARIFVDKYGWYMPASVHKISLHGSAVISAALLPIGQLSEEAQESRNKDLKNYREFHTRKCSRIHTNQDLLNRLLISSDPLISSLRKLPKKKFSSFPLEVLNLLCDPELKITSSETRKMDDSDNSNFDISSDSNTDFDY